jgi:hypothetical protein
MLKLALLTLPLSKHTETDFIEHSPFSDMFKQMLLLYFIQFCLVIAQPCRGWSPNYSDLVHYERALD